MFVFSCFLFQLALLRHRFQNYLKGGLHNLSYKIWSTCKVIFLWKLFKTGKTKQEIQNECEGIEIYICADLWTGPTPFRIKEHWPPPIKQQIEPTHTTHTHHTNTHKQTGAALLPPLAAPRQRWQVQIDFSFRPGEYTQWGRHASCLNGRTPP